jgi:hypothetical protein
MKQKQPARVERRLAAIVAADVAGYSRLMGLDEVGTAAPSANIARSPTPSWRSTAVGSCSCTARRPKWCHYELKAMPRETVAIEISKLAPYEAAAQLLAVIAYPSNKRERERFADAICGWVLSQSWKDSELSSTPITAPSRYWQAANGADIVLKSAPAETRGCNRGLV